MVYESVIGSVFVVAGAQLTPLQVVASLTCYVQRKAMESNLLGLLKI